MIEINSYSNRGCVGIRIDDGWHESHRIEIPIKDAERLMHELQCAVGEAKTFKNEKGK